MNIKYIIDDNGQIKGVFIPISEWNELKSRLNPKKALGVHAK
jgi:hypothetical protein